MHRCVSRRVSVCICVHVCVPVFQCTIDPQQLLAYICLRTPFPNPHTARNTNDMGEMCLKKILLFCVHGCISTVREEFFTVPSAFLSPRLSLSVTIPIDLPPPSPPHSSLSPPNAPA